MQKRFLVVSATALVLIGSSAWGKSESTDFSGRWDVTVDFAGDIASARLSLDAQDASPPAQARRLVLRSAAQGKAVSVCVLSIGTAPCTQIALQAQKDGRLRGAGTLDESTVVVRAQRAVRRPNAPTVHQYDPQVFQGYFSSAAAPVLRIFPGDTVRTSTVDARGVDKHGRLRSSFVNPQTGPFYIEGAMPGDTLVVHFNRITTNRDTAIMFISSIVPHALNPDFVRAEKTTPPISGLWKLDAATGYASPAASADKLKNFRIQMQPMLGCVGVAPAGGAAAVSGDLGVFGGNLDYRHINSGATLYLPVFHPGALLFMGDAHARQGDGELTFSALETSADVEFTVEVIENQSLGQVRAENADYVMIMGVGGSLSEGLQSATTGMSRWLTQTYGLSAGEIALVLGSSIEYEIAEIVDPHVNVVAKLRKTLLAQFEPSSTAH